MSVKENSAVLGLKIIHFLIHSEGHKKTEMRQSMQSQSRETVGKKTK